MIIFKNILKTTQTWNRLTIVDKRTIVIILTFTFLTVLDKGDSIYCQTNKSQLLHENLSKNWYKNQVDSILILLNSDFPKAKEKYEQIRLDLFVSPYRKDNFYHYFLAAKIAHYKGLSPLAESLYKKSNKFIHKTLMGNNTRQEVYISLIDLYIQEQNFQEAIELLKTLEKYNEKQKDFELKFKIQLLYAYLFTYQMNFSQARTSIKFLLKNKKNLENNSLLDFQMRALLYSLSYFSYINDDVSYKNLKIELEKLIKLSSNKMLNAWCLKGIGLQELLRQEKTSAYGYLGNAALIISESKQPIYEVFCYADYALINRLNNQWKETMKYSKKVVTLLLNQDNLYTKNKFKNSYLYLLECKVELSLSDVNNIAEQIKSYGFLSDKRYEFFFNSTLMRYYIKKGDENKGLEIFKSAIKPGSYIDINWASVNLANFSQIVPRHYLNPLGWFAFNIPSFMTNNYHQIDLMYMTSMLNSGIIGGEHNNQLLLFTKKVLDSELNFARYFGDLEGMEKYYALLSKYYILDKKPSLAIEYKKKSINLSKEIISKKLIAKIRLHTKPKINELAISHNNSQKLNNASSDFNWYILLSLLPFSIVSIYYFKKTRNKTLMINKLKEKIKIEINDVLNQERTNISTQLDAEISKFLKDVDLSKSIELSKIQDVWAYKKLIEMEAEKQEIFQSIHDVIWTINSENDFVTKTVSHIINYANNILTSKEIKFTFNSEYIDYNLKLENYKRKHIYMMLKEIINNCAKYSMATQVVFSIENKDNNLIFIVRDNGIGFSLENTQGNGIRNIYERCNAINATLKICSKPNMGTSFEIFC